MRASPRCSRVWIRDYGSGSCAAASNPRTRVFGHPVGQVCGRRELTRREVEVAKGENIAFPRALAENFGHGSIELSHFVPNKPPTARSTRVPQDYSGAAVEGSPSLFRSVTKTTQPFGSPGGGTTSTVVSMSPSQRHSPPPLVGVAARHHLSLTCCGIVALLPTLPVWADVPVARKDELGSIRDSDGTGSCPRQRPLQYFGSHTRGE
jgi:hypothetical protein